MPLFATNPKNNEQSADTKPTDNQTPSDQNQKSSLLTIIGQLLPLAPFAFEQFTGQKVPHMSGTMSEIQLALTQIQTNLQILANSQQQLTQRLIALENNAVQELTSLSKQFQSIRLTHSQEKKQIEFNPRPELKNTEDQNY